MRFHGVGWNRRSTVCCESSGTHNTHWWLHTHTHTPTGGPRGHVCVSLKQTRAGTLMCVPLTIAAVSCPLRLGGYQPRWRRMISCDVTCIMIKAWCMISWPSLALSPIVKRRLTRRILYMNIMHNVHDAYIHKEMVWLPFSSLCMWLPHLWFYSITWGIVIFNCYFCYRVHFFFG